jgi:hypothetical protein
MVANAVSASEMLDRIGNFIFTISEGSPTERQQRLRSFRRCGGSSYMQQDVCQRSPPPPSCLGSGLHLGAKCRTTFLFEPNFTSFLITTIQSQSHMLHPRVIRRRLWRRRGEDGFRCSHKSGSNSILLGHPCAWYIMRLISTRELGAQCTGRGK